MSFLQTCLFHFLTELNLKLRVRIFKSNTFSQDAQSQIYYFIDIQLVNK